VSGYAKGPVTPLPGPSSRPRRCEDERVSDSVPSGEQRRLVAADQELVVMEVGGGVRSYRRGGSDGACNR